MINLGEWLKNKAGGVQSGLGNAAQNLGAPIDAVGGVPLTGDYTSRFLGTPSPAPQISLKPGQMAGGIIQRPGEFATADETPGLEAKAPSLNLLEFLKQRQAQNG